jgi:hypothetical protein
MIIILASLEIRLLNIVKGHKQHIIECFAYNQDLEFLGFLSHPHYGFANIR